ncbi:hypothetical protein [Novosphingobium malaysiense]|uniref:Uncharacterized protein n=1 Tax=Novosphingobium malaysiense TaxID=1348853 RepID=A0A0B1ZVT4_9SPHN|nr:hypothetical protein [Novosphingobium malaysiense]KHK93554.1 hypothetical protein LK12_04730 [Novosphingobium malaysiense]
MTDFDLAIMGQGILPGIVALRLLAVGGHTRVLLITADEEVGGRGLELILVDRLAGPVRDLIDPMIVREWPGCYLDRGDGPVQSDERTVLVDPVQVWLELSARLDPAAIVTACDEVERAGRFMRWRRGHAFVDRVIDLEQWTGQPAETRIVGADAVEHLDLPIISDPACPSERTGAYQCIPLGDERMAIRNWTPPARASQGETDLGGGFLATSPDVYGLLNGIGSA